MVERLCDQMPTPRSGDEWAVRPGRSGDCRRWRGARSRSRDNDRYAVEVAGCRQEWRRANSRRCTVAAGTGGRHGAGSGGAWVIERPGGAGWRVGAVEVAGKGRGAPIAAGTGWRRGVPRSITPGSPRLPPSWGGGWRQRSPSVARGILTRTDAGERRDDLRSCRPAASCAGSGKPRTGRTAQAAGPQPAASWSAPSRSARSARRGRAVARATATREGGRQRGDGERSTGSALAAACTHKAMMVPGDLGPTRSADPDLGPGGPPRKSPSTPTSASTSPTRPPGNGRRELQRARQWAADMRELTQADCDASHGPRRSHHRHQRRSVSRSPALRASRAFASALTRRQGREGCQVSQGASRLSHCAESRPARRPGDHARSGSLPPPSPVLLVVDDHRVVTQARAGG